MQTATSPYHHGSLRQALVTAALAIVERDGAGALSLRRVAREVGVSAMAPYHHFADRAALVSAVAAAGFGRLADDATVPANDPGTGPAAGLVAGARAYVAFVLDNPELYRLMKNPELAARAAHPELASAAARPAERMGQMIAELAATGRLGKTRPDDAAQILWAFVHGLGLLALDGYIAGPDARATALRQAEAGATALLMGWAVSG